MKSEIKERTLKNFLLSQKHIVFTDPVDVQAGSTVTVFYNPANTPLNGKPEVWFRCSFNRWSHRKGPLPPQKMLPADGSSRVKATGETPFLTPFDHWVRLTASFSNCPFFAANLMRGNSLFSPLSVCHLGDALFCSFICFCS